MTNISLLLLTKNESQHLKSWHQWLPKINRINELIVIDDNSTDKTKDILTQLSSKNLSVKIFSRGLDNNFSAQRQFGLSKSSNDWILWLDADELPDDNMIQFLNNIDLSQYNNYAYSFKRHDIFLGHSLNFGETGQQQFIRLFNNKHGKFTGLVHEIWSSSQKIIATNNTIIHHSHQNISDFLRKINFYSDIRARELFCQHQPVNILNIIIYPLGKFIQNYFSRLGFLDGTAGIVFALGMSFHSFLVRSKLWALSSP